MPQKYDVAIVGGGMAGLTAGLYLQKLGKRSIILEHGKQPGGNMTGIWRKGFYFDCGDQSMENFGILFPVLKDLDLYNPDEWMRINWRLVSKDFEVPLRSYEQIRADFKKYFPASTTAIDEWLDYLEPMCKILEKFSKSQEVFLTSKGVKAMLANLEMLKLIVPNIMKFREFMTHTSTDICEKIFARDPVLRFVFGEYGYPNLPLFIYATFWYTFTYDYNYPKAGIQGLMNKLAAAYEERGGEIRYQSTVNKVVNFGDTVKGVITSKDEYVEAEYFINTGNPKRLVSQMLADTSIWDFKDRQAIIKGEVTPGNAAAYLGVDMSSEELLPRLKEHHTVYWRSYETPFNLHDPEAHRKGWSMISATSLFLPALAPQGKNSIVVQIYIPYAWMDDWGTGATDPFTRTERYRKLKARVLDDIIKDTEYIIPGLSDKVVYKELASPRSLARWTLNPDGASMGWSCDGYSSPMIKKMVRMKTPLKNLFQAGQYSIWPGGVISAQLSGRIVAKGIYQGFLRQFVE